MALVKVVNTSGSIVHVTNPNTVLAVGAAMIIPEDELDRNQELLRAISANVLQRRDVDDMSELPEQPIETAEDESSEEEEIPDVRFSEADLNAEPISESSFVRGEKSVIEINPQTAEEIDGDATAEKEKEYIDGIEVLEPTTDKTRVVNGVELIIEDPDDDEYDPAFVDPSI